MPEPLEVSTPIQAEPDSRLDAINVRSEELQEVIGMIPHWIIRWGITVIFIVLALLLVGSWVFRYPDVVPAAISVTTPNPPVTCMARTSGKIQHLLVKNLQRVDKDQYLVVLENTANLEHARALKKKLAAFRRFLDSFDPAAAPAFPKNWILGDMQSFYEIFQKTLADYLHFAELDYYSKKLASIDDQLQKQGDICQSLSGQIDNYAEQLQLAKDEFESKEKLYKDGIISRIDLQNTRASYLQKKSQYDSAKSNLTSAKSQIDVLEQEKRDMSYQDSRQRKQLQLDLKVASDNLQSAILAWEHGYVLKSTIAGLVTFTKFWSINQNVAAGEKVVSIIPQEKGQFLGRVVLPIQGAGKVKVGQKVRVKFADFPYMEFGLVWGEIRSKSLVAVDNLYSLEVSFPEGLKTSFNKTLDFFQEMQGAAEIITENRRLIERVLSPLKLLLAQNRGG